MNYLSETSLLSFEVTKFCNMMKEHDKCPVNCREYKNRDFHLDEKSIVNTIKEAIKMGFSGLVAFHYYNEPLLEKELILRIINQVPEARYLLWTNALLLNRKVEENDFLLKFSKVNITCYNVEDMPFFTDLSNYYGNIEIFDWELDDRLEIYEKDKDNNLSCKRPLFEIPIDYHGNIHLCCMDWKNEYQIGNIFIDSFTNIIKGKKYQNLLKECQGRRFSENCPVICKKCDKFWVSYPKY